MTLRLLFIALLVAPVLGRLAFVAAPASGMMSTLSPVLADRCQRIDIAPGTEDIAIDNETGVAFISSADRRAWYARQQSGAEGAIYAIDLNVASPSPRRVSGDALKSFSPHGISLWKGPNGERRLFVVNHSRFGEKIEIFDVGRGGALFHAETVASPAIYSPNDVAGVGRRQFLVTNDTGAESGLAGFAERYFALPLTDVAYFNGEDAYRVADGLTYANGVNVSPDGRSVYVSEVLGRRIRILERDPETAVIRKRGVIKVNTAPDNIDVAPDGALYVAGHPQIFSFLEHARKEDAISPSQVLRVDPASGRSETIFTALNGEIDGASVGAVHGDTLYVGAVFEGHILRCPLGPEATRPATDEAPSKQDAPLLSTVAG